MLRTAVRNFVIFVISIILSLVIYSFSSAEVSDGYRMGMITNVQSTGWFVKSIEGELLMGVDGVPLKETFTSTDSKGNTTTHTNIINPWSFTYKGNIPMISAQVGQYLVVHYTKSFIRNPFAEDTAYSVDLYEPIDMSPIEDSISVPGFLSSKAEGALVGRIVQASYHGLAIKTYEATIQVGVGGGQYKFMTIGNEDVYKYSIEVLKRAKLVKIYYEKLGIMNIGSFSNNDYRIIKIEVINSRSN